MLIAAGSTLAQGTVEIENASVRVLRVKQGPHEKAAGHQHPASVAVYLTNVRHRAVRGKSRGAMRTAIPLKT